MIRDFDDAHGMDLEILVNHPVTSSPTITAQTLSDELEDCGHASGDCVDIWMQANWSTAPYLGHLQAHPLDGVVSGDEFWWYEFVNTPAVTHAQAGWRMYEFGFTGSASWALFGANPSSGYTAAEGGYGPWVAASPPTYSPHTWEWNQPTNEPCTSIYTQFNQVYITNPNVDESVPGWVPGAEDVSPGRVFYARRKAIDHARLLWRLHNTDLPPWYDDTLTSQAEAALDSLIDDATDPCHVDDTCDVKATSDEVSLVVHKWLDDVFTCTGEPASTPYTGSNEDVIDAMAMDPWE